MNRIGKFVTILSFSLSIKTGYCINQNVTTSRSDGIQLISQYLTTYPNITLTINGTTARYATTSTNVHQGNGYSYRIELTSTNGAGVTQNLVPYCKPIGGSVYDDSTGHYDVTCNTYVKYANEKNYTIYDPTKTTATIEKFAFDTVWSKNGVPIDPMSMFLSTSLANRVEIGVDNGSGSYTPYVYTFKTIETAHDTVLSLNIDDVVHVNGDDAEINYSWNVTPGVPSVSTMYTKMYMQQLDSNIVMSYVKQDGSGSEVIVPNNKVVLEDTSKRLTSNGKIKLKLDNKTGFGTKSSRLRVTVEWQ